MAPMAPMARMAQRAWVALIAVTAVVTVQVGDEARARASEVQVAVAPNFARPMERIAASFASDTGHHASLSAAATGTLYAQIRAGAPYDVILSADRATPERLEEEGLAVAGTRFAYAFGKLVLYSARAGYVDPAGAVLSKAPFKHIAIAQPKLAPYGAAAIEALTALGLLEALRPKIVTGESVAQAYQFVATGNAEVGFVALSQVAAPDGPATGSYWVVPANLYRPIEQDASLLRHGESSPAARAFCDYLKTPKAQSVIRSFGYDLPSPASR
jgi:molybdate transport system substrate-binding protein